MNTLIENIKTVFDQYGKLNSEEWQILFSISKIKSLKKGDYFIKANEIKDELGFITKGCMRYFYIKEGEEITGEFWQENEISASYEGCILNQPSTLYIEALEDTTLITISYNRLKELRTEIKDLDKIIIALLERFIVESQLRIAAYITETPEERYLRLREEMPGIEERVHQKYIASFVGVTPVTLSRIRARLAKKK